MGEILHVLYNSENNINKKRDGAKYLELWSIGLFAVYSACLSVGTHVDKVSQKIKLPVSLKYFLATKYQPVFSSFPLFNIVQSTVFEDVCIKFHFTT